uniref:Uncharacterized protein n=1 Tax=Siphoviridae sp. ctINK4 TaxID=2825428 RepID=A0A8S5NVL8_9CAUD|nr:MAG TPA: hypothetical protein [Siphoviridae sp. ctINK4]
MISRLIGKIKRLEMLERKLIDSNLGYDPELLIPEEIETGWLIEGIVFETKKEALDFASRLEKQGVEAWLEELAKDVVWD